MQDWIDKTSDAGQLTTAVTSLFAKIDNLPTAQKDQVYSRLQHDARFGQVIQNFQNQPVS